MKKTLQHLLSATLIFSSVLVAQDLIAQPGYVTGDFHQHTTYTDGSYSFGKMMEMNNKFGLDWWANSEHGGGFPTWGIVTGIDLGTSVKWSAAGITPLGTANGENMWRWQELRDWSFRDVQLWRRVLPDKVIIQAYEMNVPGHEHASFAIIANQFDVTNPNVNPLAQFEYMFDNGDKDVSSPNNWIKSTKTGHEKAIEAMAWLEANYPKQSWVIPAHPERYKYNSKTGWDINHFRDLNNAAPDVFFGFESVPGHQKGKNRGEYGSTRPSYGIETYGGAGWMSAKVGGLWDAMLSEDRHFWLFANSDCHNNEDDGSDFFPGEYQKNYTFVSNKKDPQAIADGLRSGNSYVVMGDLIDSLQFKIGTAKMGGVFESTDGKISITIRLRDPQGTNNNRYSNYTNPELDHIDIIAGTVGPKVDPANTDEYKKDSVSTTKVIARFGKSSYTDGNGLVTQIWTEKADGWKEMNLDFTIPTGKKMYFRLRGTNLAINTANETDKNGNPLIDTEGLNTPAIAFADLWFYSNPVFALNKTTLSSSVIRNAEFKIYPNPVKEMLNIDFTKPQKGDLVISDFSGKTVLKSSIDGEFSKQISIKGLAKGSYIVSIDGISQKIIVD